MSFKICPKRDRNIEVTQQCLNQNPLQIIGYGYNYPVRMNERSIRIKYKYELFLNIFLIMMIFEDMKL
jgi:hypothetical protein